MYRVLQIYILLVPLGLQKAQDWALYMLNTAESIIGIAVRQCPLEAVDPESLCYCS